MSLALHRVAGVASVLTLLGLSACGWSAKPKRPNVIIITVDTLRADRLAFYGSPQDNAPFLDELARKSLVFENAWSPSSWTLPSAVSVITGVHPFQHGVNNLIGLELEANQEPIPVSVIPEDLETLTETLAAAGYRTYGIASNVLVGAEVAFDRGFDRFAKLPDLDADAVNEVASDWRNEMLQDQPFFLYVHYFDPHDMFHTRAPWFDAARSAEETGWSEDYSEESIQFGQLDWLMSRLERLPENLAGRQSSGFSAGELRQLLAWSKAAYDSEIRFVDSRIRDLFEMLQLEDAIVVFLADHGEEFYEHSHLTHGQNVYHETMRVPLLVYLPGQDARAGRVASHVSTLDIAPTLRRLIGLPATGRDQGHDLLFDAPRPPVIGFLEGKSGQHDLEGDLRSIIVGDHRLIVQDGGRAELYDIGEDPLERIDLAQANPDIVERLTGELDRIAATAPRYMRTTRMPPPPDEALLEHLQGLGYLGK